MQAPCTKVNNGCCGWGVWVGYQTYFHEVDTGVVFTIETVEVIEDGLGIGVVNGEERGAVFLPCLMLQYGGKPRGREELYAIEGDG